MRREDSRGRRVAVVADYLVNPGSPFYAAIGAAPGPVLDVLAEDGWGLMQTPPHVLARDAARPAVATIAGDAVDYLRHGHVVVILAAEGLPQGGAWLEELEDAFRDLKEAMPKVITIGLGPPPGTAASIRAALRPLAAVATASGSAPP
jgi:hypothetical protein